jgi:oligoendopeptidase F
MSDTATLAPPGYDFAPWSLDELLPDASGEGIARELAALERLVASFEAERPRLGPGLDAAAFRTLLATYERLSEAAARLGAYGSLWFASDTQSSAALAYRNRLQQVLTEVGNRTLFFTLWWKGLDDDEAARLLPRPGEDDDALHFLLDLRRQRPFTLDEPREQLVNLKDADGIEALLELYSILTNRLEFTLEVDGQRRTLTRDQLMSHAYSPDPALRAATYRELYRVYAAEATPLGQIYIHRVRDWYNETVGLRGYASPIAVRNRANDIPDAAVDTLLDVVREQAPLFQRYFRLKAEWLGLPRLSRYDVYAPLAGSSRAIAYPQAVQLVLDTFRAFDGHFAELAERVFRERHIDAEPRKGKKGGAFCATVLPSQTPWVLANYSGRLRDVATLAHELGHAVHSMLAGHHSILTQHPSLPLAETASVFAEILMTERLLREEREPAARREILVAAIDDIYATVLRQAYFVQFERMAHAAVREGASTGELSDLYFSLLQEQFGDSLELPDEFRHEWLAVPHIYQTPFYCYAYCFGQLLVLALYRRYQQEGDAFKPGYQRLLAYGGSGRPLEMLAQVGVDPSDADFWRGGFAVAAELIAELERT